MFSQLWAVERAMSFSSANASIVFPFFSINARRRSPKLSVFLSKMFLLVSKLARVYLDTLSKTRTCRQELRQNLSGGNSSSKDSPSGNSRTALLLTSAR